MSVVLAHELGIRRLLVAAGQAPSVLNTQPWRFRVAGREFIEMSPIPSGGCGSVIRAAAIST